MNLKFAYYGCSCFASGILIFGGITNILNSSIDVGILYLVVGIALFVLAVTNRIKGE